MENKKFRNVCWTLFDYTDDDKTLMLNGEAFSYSCFAEETCPSTGRPHLQGYSELKEQVRGSYLKKFHAKVHWENRLTDNGAQARQYCIGPWEGIDRKTNEKKEKPFNPTFVEKGTMKHAGKRTDLEGLVSEVLEGRAVDDIVVERPIMFHQYGRTLERAELIRRNRLTRDFMTKGYWYWGEAGTGKSEAANAMFGKDETYSHVPTMEFWDNYKQQKCVILDDYRNGDGNRIKYQDLLRLVDRYPTYVNIKCKTPMSFVSEVVIVTCPLHPRDIFTNLKDGDSLDQLYRRFEVIEFKKRPVVSDVVSEVLQGNTDAPAETRVEKIEKAVSKAKDILKKLRKIRR